MEVVGRSRVKPTLTTLIFVQSRSSGSIICGGIVGKQKCSRNLQYLSRSSGSLIYMKIIGQGKNAAKTYNTYLEVQGQLYT